MNAALTYASAFQNCQTSRVDRLLSTNYLISGFNGMTYTRAWMLDGTEECYHDLQRIEPLELRLYGEHTAVLLGRYHQFVAGRAADLRHVTLVLFREGSEWRVAYHYSTTFNEKVGSPEVSCSTARVATRRSTRSRSRTGSCPGSDARASCLHTEAGRR